MSNTERSFLMIKPDGVQRGIVGEIIKRFEAKGFKLVAMKMMWVSRITSKRLTFLEEKFKKIIADCANSRLFCHIA